MVVKEGFLPSVYKELAYNVLKTGYAYKITKSRIKRRRYAKLASLPIFNLKNIAKSVETTEFSKITKLNVHTLDRDIRG
jgi:hypothetical protein